MKSLKKQYIKYLFWIISLIFWIALIFFFWNSPMFINTDGDWVSANSTIETWLARSLFVVLFIAALYREWAESHKEDFPPYNPFIMLVIVFGYWGMVSLTIEYFS